jgi:hypothetical protein
MKNDNIMELPLASEQAKNKVVSKDYFNKIVKKIINSKSGRVTKMCGFYSCTVPQNNLAVQLLRGKGYKVSMDYNSHNVPYLIIEW